MTLRDLVVRGDTAIVADRRDDDGFRSLVLSRKVPPKWAELLQLVARYADRSLEEWLLRQGRVVGDDLLVMVTNEHIVHLPGDPLACGNLTAWGDKPKEMPLRDAFFGIINPRTGGPQTVRPCSSCFPHGLLVGIKREGAGND